MGLYDRDHRQNDPWKKKLNDSTATDSLKYNESKGDIEFDQDAVLNSSKNHLRNPKIISSRTYYKVGNREISEETHSFNKEAKFRRTQKAFMESLNERKETRSKNIQKIFPWIVFILIILVVSKVLHKNSNNQQSTEATSSIQQSTSIIEPVVESAKVKPIQLQNPQTGILSTNFSIESATCPLTLMADHKNYYVKLCDAQNGNRTVAKFFVNAGETFKTKIPAGRYMIKFGGGDDWYGEEELFGPFSQYGESETLDFTFDGMSSTGHTIMFQKMVDGNFHTNDVGRDTILKDAG